MAEAVVSLLIEHLGPMAIDRIEEEIRLVTGVNEDVRNLKTNLEDILDVLEDAEERQLKEAAVKRWLKRLKNTSEEMENVLDEWSTAVLEYEIKKQEDKAQKNSSSSSSSSSSSYKKVCFPVSFSCCSFTKVSRLVMHRDIALKIKQLNKELVRISKVKNRFNLNINTVVERPRPLQTTFLIDETKVHGRDEERSSLVSKLLCDSSTNDDGRSSLHIIPIVGFGGLGKTTLAQLAYNDEAVKTHFDERIWVCVSDPFNEIKVSKAIAEGLGNSTHSSELNAAVKCIHESIKGKRVLIVLDDVWLEDYSRWEVFREALRNGGRGSRVLVTTRKQEVAIMMGVATSQIITLKKLSEEHCWLIFRQLAFLGRRGEECLELEPIGQKIAAKSRGLPLVAKTLGSRVRFKKTAGQWEDILDSQLWESNDPKVRDVFAPFLLSFYDLPPLEKRCFLYCSVFPQDHVIERDYLIEMWMSHGYLCQRVDSWKLGRDCFESLAMRSFFQEIAENVDNGGIECKMHDIVHDFAQFLTGDECVFTEVDIGREENKAMVEENTRHLTLKAHAFPDSLGNWKNLRTLFCLPSVFGVHGEVLLFSQLSRVRILRLQSCGFEQLSENVGLLRHLRYLDLSHNYHLRELPKKLFDLCNLETLKLSYCWNIKTLPECISKLVNLKHLYIYQTPLEGLPKGLGKLSGLRTLDTIVVYHRVSGHWRSTHTQFQGFLSITGCRNARTRMDDVTKINVNAKKHVLKLELSFRCGFEFELRGITDHSDTEILNSIHPHPNLKSLVIQYYQSLTISPTWIMSLSNLTRLALYRFSNCETLPPLGKLSSLKYLGLFIFPKMCRVDEEFLGITEAGREIISFPKLEELKFSKLPQWSVWEGCCTKTTKIMPCLRTLTIDYCESLETLPEFLQMTPLQKLSLNRFDALEKNCCKEVGKEWHKISHVPNILFDRQQVQKDGVWIPTDVNE